MSSIINVNGKISSAEEAKVSVMDRGFLFGDGVYETGRSYDRCVLYLEEHWKRLRHSAEKLAIPVPWTDAQLTQGLYETLRAFKKDNAYFRTIVTRGVIDHVGLDVSLGQLQPTLVHIIQDLPTNMPEKRKAGYRVMTSKTIRNSAAAQDPNIKTSNYLNSLLALQEAKEKKYDDAIMCDAQGNVTEGTTFSLFGVTQSGVLITASLSVGILDSITRRHVIHAAKDYVKVEEGYIKLKDFQDCAEVFLASSIREIFPIREWDNKTYPTDGKITQGLYERFHKSLKSYVETHPKF